MSVNVFTLRLQTTHEPLHVQVLFNSNRDRGLVRIQHFDPEPENIIVHTNREAIL